MRSVFLLLGNKSSELQTWPDILIQLNKIGKINTKRRIQCCVPEDIDYSAAQKVCGLATLNKAQLSTIMNHI